MATKYDPLIFGSICPEGAPEFCGGALLAVSVSEDWLAITTECNKCKRSRVIPAMLYYRMNKRNFICKEEIP